MSKNDGGGWVKGDSGKSFYCSGTINNYGPSRSSYPSSGNHQSSNQVSSNSVSLSNFSGGNVSSGKSPYYLDLDSHFLSLHNKFSTFNVGYGKIHTDPVIGGNPNYTGTYIDEIIYGVHMGVSTGTLHHKLAINLYHRGVSDGDLYNLGTKLSGVTLNLCLFDLQKNNITTLGMNNFIHFFKYQNINHIDFSSNKLGDAGCGEVGAALTAGWLPNLHAIDLSDNQITNTGYGYIAKALKTVTQDIAVTFQKYKTDLGQKIIKPALKEFINYAKQQGLDTTDIATNKSAYEYFKSGTTTAWKLGWGYFKCSTYLDYVIDGITPSDIAYETIVYKLGKKAPGLHVFTCGIQASEEAFITSDGVSLVGKVIEFIGDN